VAADGLRFGGVLGQLRVTHQHPDHLDVRAQALERRGDSTDQAASANWQQDAREIRHVLQQLEAYAAVTRHHLGVGEGVDERFRLGSPTVVCQPLEHRIAGHEDRGGAPPLDSVDLRYRRVLVHHHPTRHTKRFGNVGAGLGSVARANRDQPAAQLFRRLLQGGSKEASHLEAAGWLKAFQLQERPLHRHQGRPLDVLSRPLRSRPNALDLDHCG